MIDLSGLVLPPGHALRRDLPRRIAHLADRPEVVEAYDATTLAYSAIALPERRRIHLYCPRLFNLAHLVERGNFDLDGVALRQFRTLRLARFERMVLELPAGRTGNMLRFAGEGVECTIPLLVADTTSFAGRNVLYTMQRDNDLDWVRDWIAYHVSAHGADAVVIADNGSTRYDLETLATAIATVPGIRASAVLRVPFLYGPAAKFSGLARGRFLQMAIANTVRDLLLQKARAVLSNDIDELVVSRSGRSVFDAVAASRFGAFTIPGVWRRSNPDEGRPSHRKSVYRRPGGPHRCPPKYAVVPDSPLGRTPWGTHTLIFLPRLLMLSREFWFAHCLDVTTNWRGDRGHDPLSPGTIRDEALATILERHLPDATHRA